MAARVGQRTKGWAIGGALGWERAVLLGLTLLGFALRAWRLGGQSLWSDEDITLDRARLGPLALLDALPVEHAPGYFWLQQGWTRLAGESDTALRFPSLLFGILAIPLAWYVLRRLVGREAALVLGLLVAVNPFLVSYGQEARMYSALLALSLAALAAALRAERETGARAARAWAACGALAAACVYSHYYGVLTAIVLAAWALVALYAADPGVRARAFAGWAGAGLLALLLFLPWLPRALGVLGYEGWREEVPLALVPVVSLLALASRTVTTAGVAPYPDAAPRSGLESLTAGLFLGFALVGTIWLLVRCRGLPRRGPDALGALRVLLWALAPALIVGLLVSRDADMHPRYLLGVAPAFLALAAAGVASLPRPAVPVAALGLALLAWSPLRGWYADPAEQKQDYRALLAPVVAAAEGRDSVLLLDGPSMGLAKRYLPEDSPVKLENLRSETNDARDEAGMRARLEELAGRRPKVWLATNGEAEGIAKDFAQAWLFPLSTEGVQDITLSRYHARPRDFGGEGAGAGLSGPWTARRACFDAEGGLVAEGAGAPPATATAGAALCAASALPRSVEGGHVLPVELRWETGEAWPPAAAPDGRLRLSLRLVDETGARPVLSEGPMRMRATGGPETAGQGSGDRGAGGDGGDRLGLLLPAALSPGTYGVELVIYDPATLEPWASWRLGELEVLAGGSSGEGAGSASPES